MPTFRLFSVKLRFEPDLAVAIIVRVRSTACNHGPVLRGCMTMQSTTYLATLEVIRCRQSSACVFNDPDQIAKMFFIGALIMALTSGTTPFSE